ncbi:class III poly(R)-hydroxyalkanoic acid synthase subunit PhaC [Beggiatoa leptomitoformis]|uniref:Poly(3-hydroxyalkanoate) polymerase subunit PhaC n=1 Tax=Beggiatoa leptomitoformis TaxID=288004 RepID=A0A2N9YAJ1_9GAMM|nr:class III poly(R)-hydroxyalkanoic acid synthase subunit PhaC [Beggiatoa leptomitoformis]ALG67125.1 class III poly(R)-hydroxyalkanoic acid synthase subunit PhaC [Beggiatoa leptomitoformis]AUI67478.1 class III poly(R)-hydroxyalkanoic acid synthase subunit PhaC [Beggiatoa leptomitoformis]
MSPLNIRMEHAVQEMLEFNKKLGEGLKTLADITDIDIGSTPKEAVYKEDNLVLYRYKPIVDNPNPIPLLIIYALVNRPYMLDLQANRSTIRGLLETGQDVYLIDWGYPDEADRYLTLEDYIHGYIHRCVKTLCKRHGINKVNVLGVCQGGTLSVCYSALYPQKVKNLITMVTPIDFHTPDNLLSHWLEKIDVDLLVDTMGNIPGELLNWTFLSMKPFRLTGQKYLEMVDSLHNTEAAKNFLRMEKWIFDSPDQAGEAFRQFTKWFFQQNALINNKLIIGEKRVDLQNITMPILNIYATEDHIVPPKAAIALKKLVKSTDYQELALKAGHIGIYVSERVQKTMPNTIGSWLDTHD